MPFTVTITRALGGDVTGDPGVTMAPRGLLGQAMFAVRVAPYMDLFKATNSTSFAATCLYLLLRMCIPAHDDTRHFYEYP